MEEIKGVYVEVDIRNEEPAEVLAHNEAINGVIDAAQQLTAVEWTDCGLHSPARLGLLLARLRAALEVEAQAEREASEALARERAQLISTTRTRGRTRVTS